MRRTECKEKDSRRGGTKKKKIKIKIKKARKKKRSTAVWCSRVFDLCSTAACAVLHERDQREGEGESNGGGRGQGREVAAAALGVGQERREV